MQKKTAEKLFRVLVIGGVMLGTGQAASACGERPRQSTGSGIGQDASAFDAGAAAALNVPKTCSWLAQA